jgi:CBS domain-containing protein
MMTVRDVMTAEVVSVHPTDPVREVAQALVDRRISGLPVVEDGVVVGVVSEADFLIKEQGPEGLHRGALDRVLGPSREHRAMLAKVEARTVRDLMTSPAITIGPRQSTSEAARIMTTQRVNRLPVVLDGRLVGIVTRADLVRAFARSDEELARTIREDVLLRILWLDPTAFNVEVHAGVASISGTAERRSTAELIRETVALIPGIVDVIGDLPWSLDDRHLEPATRDMVFPHGLR